MGVLHELITPDAAVLPTEDQNGKKNLTLKETCGQKPICVQIRNVPEDIVAIKADKFPAPKNIFNGAKGECKRADFIVIARTPRKNWVLFIEIKSGNTAQRHDVEKQLRGAECLLAYCRSIGREFWKKPRFLAEENYKMRFVYIKNTLIDKRPTRKPGPVPHDKPENMLVLSSPNKGMLEFNKIINS